jgi:hypothetical protein
VLHCCYCTEFCENLGFLGLGFEIHCWNALGIVKAIGYIKLVKLNYLEINYKKLAP